MIFIYNLLRGQSLLRFSGTTAIFELKISLLFIIFI